MEYEMEPELIATVAEQPGLDDELSLCGETGGRSRVEMRQVFTI